MLKNKPKLLFIVSKDFGELYHATIFAKKLAARYEILFLLPDNLYALNFLDFEWSLKKYSKAADIKSIIIEYLPKVCFLFSGYLFSINKLFSLRELEELIRLLISYKAIVFTSDPWLNIWSNLNTTNNYFLNFNDPSQLAIINYFNNIKKKFKNVYSLFNFPLDNYPENCLIYRSEYINSNLCGRIKLNKAFKKKYKNIIKKPFWIFVVSAEDANFIDDKLFLFAERIKDAISEKRQVVLVIPEKITQKLISFLENIQVTIMSGLSLANFKAILYAAECAFYFNFFSATIQDRLFSNKPVFAFDEGHMSKYFLPYLQYAKKIYHGKNTLIKLSLSKSLSVKKVINYKYKKSQRRLQKYILKKISKLPSVDNIMQNLLKG